MKHKAFADYERLTSTAYHQLFQIKLDRCVEELDLLDRVTVSRLMVFVLLASGFIAVVEAVCICIYSWL